MISSDRIIAPGGLASYQTGFIDGTSTSTGSGEDIRYVDVTISSVDTTKAICLFQGGGSSSAALAMLKAEGSTGTTYECTARLTSATNLRIATKGTPSVISGRWQVAEFQ